ncbi:DUF4328 domain-containing protein [Streptomyces sp. NPDC086787]|uniref:DUF4328 domain-containing protein n=1 Tax=Streptomyces sp. NPDC086787 TaxID=3365759 RepID=UPI0037F11413
MNDRIVDERTARLRIAAHCAVATLLLAGAAWTVRAVWEIRLAMAGEPASGPPDQGEGQHRPLTSLEDSYHFVTTVGGFAVLLCAVMFLSWLLRVRDNARALSGQPPRYTGLWVYIGWWLPIANLWVPRGIVADAYRTSTGGTRVPPALNVWWGLWLLGLPSGVGVVYADAKDKIIERAYTEVWPLLVSDAAMVGAAVAAVFVVRAVTAAASSAQAGVTPG